MPTPNVADIACREAPEARSDVNPGGIDKHRQPPETLGRSRERPASPP